MRVWIVGVQDPIGRENLVFGVYSSLKLAEAAAEWVDGYVDGLPDEGHEIDTKTPSGATANDSQRRPPVVHVSEWGMNFPSVAQELIDDGYHMAYVNSYRPGGQGVRYYALFTRLEDA